MRIEVVRDLDERAWRRFVDEHPQGQVFHTPEMFQVFARAKGHKPTLWAAVDGAGRVVALLLPVRVSLFNDLFGRLACRDVVYGSVLYSPTDEGLAGLEKVLDTYQRKMAGASLFTELRNLSDLTPAQEVLERFGFAYEDHLNFLINLDRPAEEIMQSIGPRTRKQIRRGLRRGAVTVEEARDREQVSTIYELLRQTYRVAGIPLADRSLFEAAFDLLYPKGMIRFTLARVGEFPAAASVELLYKDTAYGWYGGTSRAYSSYQPDELLTWHVLEWSAENGYKLYDFGGAGKPGEPYGVRDFKAKFGGNLVCFGRYTYVHAPRLLRLSKWAYVAYRHLPRRPFSSGNHRAKGRPASVPDSVGSD
ncbi:MAG: GNAT family N-acetyltransferase [Chloroflexi bacterium]|nr:GNAT family N-acetyltransferase [Chloroflexota bacterium]